MRAETALRFSQRALVINSFSKYYAMTGWRLGWLVAPTRTDASARALAAVARDLRPDLSQRAALAAFDAGDELRRTAPPMRETGRFCWTAFPNWDWTFRAARRRFLHLRRHLAFHRRFRSGSVGECCRKLASRRRPASILIRAAAQKRCGSLTPGRRADVREGVVRLEAWLRRP